MNLILRTSKSIHQQGALKSNTAVYYFKDLNAVDFCCCFPYPTANISFVKCRAGLWWWLTIVSGTDLETPTSNRLLPGSLRPSENGVLCTWHRFFKVYIEFVTIFLLLFVFWCFGCKVCGILAPQPGVKLTPPASKGKVLTPGPPRKFLRGWYL